MPATEELISLLRDVIGLTTIQELKLRDLEPAPIEEVAPPALAPAKPHVVWTVGKSPTGGQLFVCASFTRAPGLTDRSYFVGHPARLKEFRRGPNGWEPFKSHGEECPPEVAAQYARQFDPTNAGLSVTGINDPGPSPDYSKCPPNTYIPGRRKEQSHE